MPQLCLPTQAAGAHAGRLRQRSRERLRTSRDTSTSAGLSRGGTAASVSPATDVGRQILETVDGEIDASPASIARWISFVNTPGAPMSATGPSCCTSPAVAISTISTVCPSSRSRAATQSACQRASLLARVPSRNVFALLA